MPTQNPNEPQINPEHTWDPNTMPPSPDTGVNRDPNADTSWMNPKDGGQAHIDPSTTPQPVSPPSDTAVPNSWDPNTMPPAYKHHPVHTHDSATPSAPEVTGAATGKVSKFIPLAIIGSIVTVLLVGGVIAYNYFNNANQNKSGSNKTNTETNANAPGVGTEDFSAINADLLALYSFSSKTKVKEGEYLNVTQVEAKDGYLLITTTDNEDDGNKKKTFSFRTATDTNYYQYWRMEGLLNDPGFKSKLTYSAAATFYQKRIADSTGKKIKIGFDLRGDGKILNIAAMCEPPLGSNGDYQCPN